MPKTRWTQDEMARADTLVALKISLTEIDNILGKGRGTTRSMYRRKTETKEARAKRLRYHNDRRLTYVRRVPGGGRDVPYVPPIEKWVPAAVLAERACALSQPLSLGALLMGDPPLTRSALGKRVERGPHISLPPIRALMNCEVAL